MFTCYFVRVIKSRKMRWEGHVACLARKPEGKRPLGRPRHRWEGNIRMELMEIRWEGVDWVHLAQERDQWQALVNMVMNHAVP
jgi:hypothetical protein